MRTLAGWLAVGAGLVAAVVLSLLATTSDEPKPIETEQTPLEPSLVGVPRSADGAERWLANQNSSRPAGVPGSADGAERWLANQNSSRPAGVPGSADAAERWLANQNSSRPAGVPGSADAAERWLAQPK